MWTFLFSFLFLRRLGLSKPIRYILVMFMLSLILVVFIYTTILFFTLEERISAPHVHTYTAL